MVQYIDVSEVVGEDGRELPPLRLSYEIAGQPWGTAPIVLVNHALTGNSSVAAPSGWWASLVGPGQGIDTERYTILSFNIPGNGYLETEGESPLDLSLYDVAALIIGGLEALEVAHLYAVIGASLGGALSLQISYLRPQLAEHTFCIASDYRASDWLLGQTLIQQRILDHSSEPLEDARIHAMLCYRTPESINKRFGGQSSRQPGQYDVVSWLEYHGDTLRKRFLLSAYRLMTRLTASIHVCQEPQELARIQGAVHWISIDSDLLFPHHRMVEAYEALRLVKQETTLDTLSSIHGHDAFLMDYPQLERIIRPYF